jgi:hypothetical protein
MKAAFPEGRPFSEQFDARESVEKRADKGQPD